MSLLNIHLNYIVNDVIQPAPTLYCNALILGLRTAERRTLGRTNRRSRTGFERWPALVLHRSVRRIHEIHAVSRGNDPFAATRFWHPGPAAKNGRCVWH